MSHVNQFVAASVPSPKPQETANKAKLQSERFTPLLSGRDVHFSRMRIGPAAPGLIPQSAFAGGLGRKALPAPFGLNA